MNDQGINSIFCIFFSMLNIYEKAIKNKPGGYRKTYYDFRNTFNAISTANNILNPFFGLVERTI